MRRATLLLLLVAVVFAASPAIKSTISQKGLDQISSIAMSIVKQQIASVSLPDIHGKTGTPIGTIDYDLTNMKLDNIQWGTVALNPVPGKGVFVKISNLGCHVFLNWHYSTWIASDSGSADVNVHGVTVQIEADIGAADDRPTCTVGSCNVDIQGLDIDIHGGASWLYQIFVNIFSGQIKDTVRDALRTTLTQTINDQARSALATIPVEESIDDWSVIDYSLDVPPTFTADSLTMGVRGEFYAQHNPQECPAAHHELPDTTSDAMVQLYIDSFLADSLSFVYFTQGRLQYDVDDSQIPDASPVRLNTSSFQGLIEGLYDKYPNMLMQLHVSAVQAPTVTIDASGIKGQIVGNLNTSVILPRGGMVEAFALKVLVDFAGEAHCDGERLLGSVSLLQTSLSLTESYVGDFDVEPLQDIADFICTAGALPLINKSLSKGFAIPSVEGVVFENPKIAYGDNYVSVMADIGYQPGHHRVHH